MSDVNKIIQNRKKQSSHLAGDAGEGLWAVSYADLLMVLMSFFIIFFNLEENKGKNQSAQAMSDIVYELQTDLSALKKNVASNTIDPNQDIEAKGRTPGSYSVLNSFKSKGQVSASGEKSAHKYEVDNSKGIVRRCETGESKKCSETKLKETISFYSFGASELKDENVSKAKKNSGIMIDFPQNIYAPGAFKLNEKTQARIISVLDKLRPHMGKINLVFVGHSDEIPVMAQRRVIDSNLILSSLRASKAVELAINNGFDPIWVSAQGVGEHNRNSRTLSLRVVMR